MKLTRFSSHFLNMSRICQPQAIEIKDRNMTIMKETFRDAKKKSTYQGPGSHILTEMQENLEKIFLLLVSVMKRSNSNMKR